MKLTMAMLEKNGACEEATEAFKSRWGLEAPLDSDFAHWVLVVMNRPDWAGWLVANVANSPILAEYRKAHNQILAEYEKAMAPIRAEYNRAMAPIWAEYEKVMAPIQAEYDKAMAPIWAEYDKAKAPIQAEYDKARVIILEQMIVTMGLDNS